MYRRMVAGVKGLENPRSAGFGIASYKNCMIAGARVVGLESTRILWLQAQELKGCRVGKHQDCIVASTRVEGL